MCLSRDDFNFKKILGDAYNVHSEYGDARGYLLGEYRPSPIHRRNLSLHPFIST